MKTFCHFPTYVVVVGVFELFGLPLTLCMMMVVGMVKEILGTYKIQYHPEEDNPDKVSIYTLYTTELV